IHPLQSGIEADMLQALIEDYGPELCIKAIDRAVLRRKRTIKYVAGILRRWQQDGYDEADGSVQGEIPEEIKAIPF
ncbi:DnaD domain protein, partial [Bifidobacterium longum]|uniref:DnaD domain protein n=3 Tax=Bacillati TaxID=1783272 RepID=UPI001D064DA9